MSYEQAHERFNELSSALRTTWSHWSRRSLDRALEDPKNGKVGGFTDQLPKSGRFERNVPPETNDGKLCHRCQRIDFESIFAVEEQELGRDGIPVINLEGLTPDLLSSHCSMCVLFASAAFSPTRLRVTARRPTTKEGQSWHIRAVSCSQILRLTNYKPPIGTKPSIALAVVNWPWSAPFLPKETFIQAIETEIILQAGRQHRDVDNIQSIYYQARILDRPFIDYEILKEWVRDCRETHDKCGEAWSTCPSNMRVIDCTTRTIVPLLEGSEYLTLSYVWGPNHAEALIRLEGSTVDALPQELPQTIEDAIIVVLMLGKRYLWVDRYCIDQRDAKDKKEQIHGMAEIFENATATIVALGPDADSGLPGVSDVPRASILRARSGEHTLVSSAPILPLVLTESPWSTRGWTYQEALLSHRCLIFTNMQVSFVCSMGAAHESIKQPKLNTFPEDYRLHNAVLGPALFDNTSSQGHNFTDPANYCLFLRHLREYTSRHLSDDADSLNAFRGLLLRSNTRTYWGIPIFENSSSEPDTLGLVELGFVHGLCWFDSVVKRGMISVASQKEQSLHNLFPSWSWASTKRTIRYSVFHEDSKLEFNPLGITFVAKLWVEDEGGEPVSLSRYLDEHQSTSMVPEISPILLIRSYAAKMEITGQVVEMADKSLVFNVNIFQVIMENGEVFASRNIGQGQAHIDSKAVTDPKVKGLIKQFWESSKLLVWEWDTVLLMNRVDNAAWWMIVQDFGGTFRRVGMIISTATDVRVGMATAIRLG